MILLEWAQQKTEFIRKKVLLSVSPREPNFRKSTSDNGCGLFYYPMVRASSERLQKVLISSTTGSQN
jgi:hypothetical protein